MPCRDTPEMTDARTKGARGVESLLTEGPCRFAGRRKPKENDTPGRPPVYHDPDDLPVDGDPWKEDDDIPVYRRDEE